MMNDDFPPDGFSSWVEFDKWVSSLTAEDLRALVSEVELHLEAGLEEQHEAK